MSFPRVNLGCSENQQYDLSIIQQRPLQREDIAKREEIEKLFLEAKEIFCQKMESSSVTLDLQIREIEVLDPSQPEWKGASKNEISFVKTWVEKEADEDSLEKLVRLTQKIKTLLEELHNLKGDKVRINHVRKQFSVARDYPFREKSLIHLSKEIELINKQLDEVNNQYEKFIKVQGIKPLTESEQSLIRQTLEIDFLIGKKEGLLSVYNKRLENIETLDPEFIFELGEEIISQKTTIPEEPLMGLNMSYFKGVEEGVKKIFEGL